MKSKYPPIGLTCPLPKLITLSADIIETWCADNRECCCSWQLAGITDRVGYAGILISKRFDPKKDTIPLVVQAAILTVKDWTSKNAELNWAIRKIQNYPKIKQ